MYVCVCVCVCVCELVYIHVCVYMGVGKTVCVCVSVVCIVYGPPHRINIYMLFERYVELACRYVLNDN